MRIIHFSDFHLEADYIERAESIMKRFLGALLDIDKEKRIDLILFTGDMIDKAGDGFNEPKITTALNLFREKVIDVLLSNLKLPANRFVFTMGNHEVDRSTTTPDEDNKLTVSLTNHEKVDWYLHHEGKNEPRIAEFNQFRDYYWKTNKADAELVLTPFQYGVKLIINGQKVGINCLNTSWRCFESKKPIIKDEHKIVMGKSQITDSRLFFEDCQVRLAIGHHHPLMMNPFEKTTLQELIARNYDAFFNGHTHDADGEYINRPQGCCFYFTSPGTLSTNESAERKYRNGFMVIDYELDKRYVEAQCYYQDDNADFVKDNNYGNYGGEGIWHQPLPGSTIIKPMSLSLLCMEKDGEFLENDRLRDIIAKLKDDKNATIQMVALSGLGKTRILREAFDDGVIHQNYYYCEYSDNMDGLLYDVQDIIVNHKGQDGLIVLDNCPNSLLEQAISKRDEYGSLFRIIGVNNEYYDRRNLSVKDILPIFFTQDDTRQMTEDFIERRIPAVNGDNTARDSIKKIADGFPGMAVILVEEYLKENNVNVHTVDHVVKKMLRFDRGKEHDQEITLRSLALFQPFPYKDEYREAYRFIREDEGITPLFGKSPEEKRYLFSQTIGRYENSLVEITQSWLNVRPFPLAVWLVSKWFEDGMDEERIEEIVVRIQSLDDPLYRVVRDGIFKRLEYMQDSIAAQDLIQRLAVGEHPSFCNEKVVCSDLGSRLFLAMSSVNPVAIASCLLQVLMPKPIAWVKENVAGDIRRNLVWALEKLCFNKDSFHDGVKVMALLSVAENETWGNNASAQLKQLFHIMLPGTEATLQDRIQAIEYLRSKGNDYLSITLDCIDSAFENSNFVRDGAGSKFGLKSKKDYSPKSNYEIVLYWEQCRDILIKILSSSGNSIDRVAKMLVSHTLRWAYDGMLTRMFSLFPLVAEMKRWQWEEMYNALNQVGKRRMVLYPQEFREEVERFKQRIRPIGFCQKLKDARMAVYNRYDIDIREQIEYEKRLFSPLAHEFISDKIFLSIDEVREIVTDKEYTDVWFSLALFEIITEEELEGLLDVFRRLIKELGGDSFNSNFVFRICYVFRENEAINIFLTNVFQDGFHSLYVRLAANCETDSFNSYERVKIDIQQGRLDLDATDLYLRSLSLTTQNQVGAIIRMFHEDYPTRIEQLMDFICLHRFDKELFNEPATYIVIQKVVLAYPIIAEHNRSNNEYAALVVNMLKAKHDDAFAILLNKKLIEDLNQGYLRGSFTGIYGVLVKDYRDVIWNDFECAFVSDDHDAFIYQISDEIGSGTGFGAGPLFQVEDNRIQEMCKKFPITAPSRVANLIPVFKDDYSFSDWFYWLLDEFGNQEVVLDSLHANMGTYFWTGSVVPLLEQKKRCLMKIQNHPRLEVQHWVEMNLKEIEEEEKHELTREEYMRLHYN